MLLQLTILEATAGFEPAMEVLQTSALPLGYVAVCNTKRSGKPLMCAQDAVDRGLVVSSLDLCHKTNKKSHRITDGFASALVVYFHLRRW